jgi:type II secretory pathway pseudopilin PulG
MKAEGMKDKDEGGRMKDEGGRRNALHPSSFILHPFCRSAFTLIEMLTTVAVLIIVLGLMVNLARHVRDRSAQLLTRDMLNHLDVLTGQYLLKNDRQYPAAEPLLAAEMTDAIEDRGFEERARRNNEQLVAAIKSDYRNREPMAVQPDPFENKCPISVYDRKTVRDAWGRPIVFMPRQHELIGLAPSQHGQDRYFFFSAGPDRKYLTRQDNLYSYESLAPSQ